MTTLCLSSLSYLISFGLTISCSRLLPMSWSTTTHSLRALSFTLFPFVQWLPPLRPCHPPSGHSLIPYVLAIPVTDFFQTHVIIPDHPTPPSCDVFAITLVQRCCATVCCCQLFSFHRPPAAAQLNMGPSETSARDFPTHVMIDDDPTKSLALLTGYCRLLFLPFILRLAITIWA